VAIVRSEGQSGSLVVTGQGVRKASLASVVPYATGQEVMFQPVASPGAGALAPRAGRRVLHTCHHRTQVQTWLRLAGRHVPAIYGPSGDVTWDEAGPTYSVEAANRGA
jgi:hypothetical protein